MPIRSNRPCPGYGPRRGCCPNIIKPKESCCVECIRYKQSAIKRYDKKRNATKERKFLHSRIWRKLRAMKLARDPLCEKCQSPAVLVHHIDENELNSGWDNLMSLCFVCHEVIHGRKKEKRREGGIKILTIDWR